MASDRSSTYTHTIGAQWFQNAVQTITDFSGKKKQTLCKDNVYSSYMTLPSCTIPFSGSKDKNVYLPPTLTLSLNVYTGWQTGFWDTL